MKTGMKTHRMKRRLGALFLAAMLAAGVLTVGAAAAEVSTVTAKLRPDVTIIVDGIERTFYSAQGREVHAILYNGTHYLPVRAIGELMGKNVNWDQSTLTAALSGVRTTAPVQGTPDTAAREQNISVQLRPDFAIVVDSTIRTFTDAQGNAVYPMLHNGANYLPIRAIGELMGKTVSWNGDTKTISLAAPTGDGLVTDADSFSQSGQPTTDADSSGLGSASAQAAQPSGPQISAEDAKAKALAHAGLSAGQATFLKAKLDRDDGRAVYEVEFYTADYREYDYDIDAYTGAVLSFDHDAEDYAPPAASYIGEEKAVSVALDDAGFTAAQVSHLRCYLDRDDGRYEYNVEFYQGTMEYDYEINAYTGAILSRDVESIYD